MAAADHYILKVTAGPSYDRATHTDVLVNTTKPTHVSTEKIDANIITRIQNYRGLPENSPSTSPYFKHEKHTSDLYSIEFSFTPKETLSGYDLVFGNDFDHPIRDRLPWGFETAFGFVKKFVDPGLYGDVRADVPYLYGPLLSSINVLRVGGKNKAPTSSEKAKGGSQKEATEEGSIEIVQEGAEGTDGTEIREELGIPADAAARMKHFLAEDNLKNFEFEAGREYSCDFFNPYLDFNEFALKLPIITIPIIKYWDGQPLRYVLKNRKTDETLFVILFTLLPRDQDSAEDTDEFDDTDEEAEEINVDDVELNDEPVVVNKEDGIQPDDSTGSTKEKQKKTIGAYVDDDELD